jgi:hypothetical protein
VRRARSGALIAAPPPRARCCGESGGVPQLCGAGTARRAGPPRAPRRYHHRALTARCARCAQAQPAQKLQAGPAAWWQPGARRRAGPRDDLRGTPLASRPDIVRGCTAHKHAAQPVTPPPRNGSSSGGGGGDGDGGARAAGMRHTVAVVVGRNAFDWVRGLCEKPWEVRKLNHDVALGVYLSSATTPHRGASSET